MPYSANVVKVIVASPCDPLEERSVIQTAIGEWNRLHSEEYRTVLLPIMWETHSTPEMGARPQAIINRQIVDSSDLLIAVFWTRLGTHTGMAPSGTVEEIQRHLQAGKPAMIYFSNRSIDPNAIDNVQYDAVKSFRQECQKRGHCFDFRTSQEFSKLLTEHLTRKVREFFPNPRTQGATISGGEQLAEGTISEAARALLVALSKERGDIVEIRSSLGSCFRVGNKVMNRVDDRRMQAELREGIEQLVKLGLIVSTEQGFTLTARGHRFLDKFDDEAAKMNNEPKASS